MSAARRPEGARTAAHQGDGTPGYLNVSSWAIRNPIPVILLSVLLTLAGLMAFPTMKVQSFPDIDVPSPSACPAAHGSVSVQ